MFEMDSRASILSIKDGVAMEVRFSWGTDQYLYGLAVGKPKIRGGDSGNGFIGHRSLFKTGDMRHFRELRNVIDELNSKK